MESLIEQRAVSSPGLDPRIVRISVGLEDLDDLKADLVAAMTRLVDEPTN